MNEVNATPHAELIADLMNPNNPKNEREQAAVREIERLRETQQAVIAGALFDFLGWLTSRKERLVLSGANEAGPAVEAITAFSKMRGLSLDDARVQDWHTTPSAAQPEPVSMRMPKVSDKVICLEDESLGEVVSLTAGGSPDIAFDDGSRGTYLLREFAELFGYVTPPAAQRTWVGLTPEEVKHLYPYGRSVWGKETYEAIEKALKERNT